MSEKTGKYVVKAAVGIGLIVVVVIALIVPLWWFFAFETIDELEYGIKQNNVDRTIDTSKIYDAGRYDVGFFNDMIRFPKTAQTIEYFTPELGEQRDASSV